MITLSQKQQIIISAFRDGKSLRAIARDTGIDRDTVTKYVRDYEEKRRRLLEQNDKYEGGFKIIRRLDKWLQRVDNEAGVPNDTQHSGSGEEE